jgi:hypothetical protein
VSIRARLERWLLHRAEPPPPLPAPPEPKRAQPPQREPEEEPTPSRVIDLFGFESSLGFDDEPREAIAHPVDGSAPIRLKRL